MASISLPALGAKPWNLNPPITAINNQVEDHETRILVLEAGGGGGGGGSIVSVNGDVGPVVVLNQDEVLDGTTYKQYSATEKTKLAAIASGATANSSDATLLARANHTGTQAISTVTGLQTALDGKAPVIADPNADRIRFWDDSAGAEAYLTPGTNLSITGTTLNATGGGSVAWGAVTGTLSAQTDLQAALDAKVSVIADPNADRLRGWDDSAGAEAYFTLGTNLSITGTTINATGGSGTAAPIFYPEDYGAVGDGTTSDETALQNCKTAALAAGGVMHLTKGRKYRMTNTLSYINVECLIEGEGELVQAPGFSTIYVRHEATDTVTVTGVTTPAFLGPATTNDVSKPSNTVTKIDAAAANMSKFQAGEPWLIRSQNAYPWSNRGAGSSSEYPVDGYVWMQDWTKILGVVIPWTTAGSWTIREGDTITGVTSGATAQVLAHHVGQLLVRDVVGTFTTSENLNVGGTLGGTITGAAWVAVPMLDEAFATSPVMDRMRPDLRVNINVGLSTYTDPFDVLGSSARKDSIQIVGAIDPVIRVNSRGAYASALQIATSFGGDIYVKAKNSPNLVVSGGSSSNISTEGGYGYAAEALGAVAECRFLIHATSLRHAFTTNPFEFSSGTYPASIANNRMLTGVGRDNVVSGVASECFSDGFNTHEGAKRTKFTDCFNFRTLSGGRYQSGTKGFENRGLSTQYTNCHDDGSPVGFWDSSMGHRTGGFIDEVTYVGCSSKNNAEIGFYQSQAAYAGDVHRRIYVNPDAGLNGNSRPSSSPNTQKAFSFSGVDTTVIGLRAARFNSDAILLSNGGSGAATTLHIKSAIFDYRDSPNTSAVNAIRTFGGNFRVIVGDIDVYQNPSFPTMPNHIIRATSGNPTILFAGSQRTINTDNPIPRYLISAGTPVLGYVLGQDPRTVVSATAPTGDLLTGDLWIDTATNTVNRYNGSGWTSVSGSGSMTGIPTFMSVEASPPTFPSGPAIWYVLNPSSTAIIDTRVQYS